MELVLLLIVVGLVGGCLAGWLGIGGGILLAPLLLFVPPALGLDPLDMKEVARLTMLQSLCSTAAAALAHRRAGQVHGPLVVWMGALIAVASLSGAWISELQLVSSEMLLGLFATMALVASLLMLRRVPDETKAQEESDDPTPNHASFSRPRATAAAVGVGFLGGMVGQSGAFLTIPLLIHGLHLPTRLAIGSALGITFCAALAGSFGKVFAGGPIIWPQVAALVAGSLAGSQLGARLSHRLPTRCLRVLLAIVIGASAVGMGIQLLR